MSDDATTAAKLIVEMDRRVPLPRPTVQVSGQSWDAAVTVARAYLAEHPADDSQPVTEEWLATLSLEDGTFADTPNGEQLGFHVGDAGAIPGPRVIIMDSTDGDDQVVISVPTRGHVRRLLTAFGVTPQ